MLGLERLRYIHSRVERDSAVKVDELAEELQVSAITIRRDLKSLEEQGKLTRTYGGAVSAGGRTLNFEESYGRKQIHAHGAKTAMARCCAGLIPDGASVILDAGTSTYEAARILGSKKHLTAITYDLRIAAELYQFGITTFVGGGEVQSSTGALFGPATEEFIARARADIAVIGVAGIASDGVLYTPTMSKAKLKQKVMHSSETCILLADSVKFDVMSLWEICHLSAFDHIITDADFSPEEWERRGVDPDRVSRVYPDEQI